MSIFGGLNKTKTSFSFGSTSSPSIFGAGASGTSGFSFGRNSTTSSGFSLSTTTSSFGLFGSATATTTTSSFSSFGSFGTSKPSFGGFGTPTTTTQSFSFGFGTPSSSPSFKFGFGATTTAPTTTTPSLTFGKPFGGSLGIGGFGSTVSQTPAAQSNVSLIDALKVTHVYGDERDLIIRKWNQLQALYGAGTLFCGPNNSFNVDETNGFAAFKGFTYNVKPHLVNEEGLVSLIFKKKVEDVYSQKQSIIDMLYRLFGSNVNISVHINGIKPLPEDHTEVLFYVTEKLGTEATGMSFVGGSRCVSADDVYTYIQNSCNQAAPLSIGSSNANWKQQLENSGIVKIYAHTSFTEKDIKKYLEQPPEGIHEIIWNQAKLGNPDPSKFIPFPLIGFKGVRNRLYMQQYEASIQEQQLKKAREQMVFIEAENRVLKTRAEALHKNLLDISHRTLKIMICCETRRRLGVSLSANEDRLMVHIAHIMDKLVSPSGLRPRLYRIIAEIDIKKEKTDSSVSSITLSDAGVNEIYSLLRNLQEGIRALFEIVQEDLRVVNALRVK